MLPFSLDPKKIQSVMKHMGIKQEEIDAEEVIIKTKGRELLIRNPQVSKINMQGQDMLQITGKIEERINNEDILTVARSADVSEKEAKEALEKAEGDLAKAILMLKK